MTSARGDEATEEVPVEKNRLMFTKARRNCRVRVKKKGFC